MKNSIQTSHQPLPDLIARFKVKRGLFRTEKVEAKVYALDQHTCIFKTDKLFNPGDTLLLDLVMTMPFENVDASALSALITERKKHCSNFFYLVDFIDFGSRSANATQNRLERICRILTKKQSLRSRRNRATAGLKQSA
ncbi:MAG: hypothetical protein KGY54_01905 [Oleiphilaceae bacterium]|nr:hypothetical protein [Oleiphilaceae bacterium]